MRGLIGVFAMSIALAAFGSSSAVAQDPGASFETAPPDAPYQPVSELVELPDFLPGLGQLFVDPETLPAGPFLAYDRDGNLVSTVYMIPTEDLGPDRSFDDLAMEGGAVDHVDVHYNAGHPGVERPHAHIVLWHVEDEARVQE